MSQNNQNENSQTVPNLVAARRENYDFGPSAGLVGSDIDVQVATAKRFPRSIGESKQRAIELATLDQKTATDCIYAIPRAGKIIEGPSTRLAEIVAATWGNLRVSAKTICEDDRFTYAQGVCWDLESNTAISYETKRRITNKNGERFNDDMITTTSSAATSIALRNVVFRVIPRAFVNEVYDAARKAAAGNIRTLKQRRAEMLQYFAGQSVSEKQILDLLGIAKIDDISIDHLTTLKGIATSIKEGVVSIEAIFNRDDDQNKAKSTETKPENKSQRSQASEDDVVNGSKLYQADSATDLNTQKANLINEILTELGALYPNDTIDDQAARIKLLKYVFGKTVIDEITKLPVQILEAGLKAMKSQAVNVESNDDLPV